MEQILISQKDKDIMVEKKNFNNEKEMQEIIKNNPNLINLNSIFDSPLLVVGRENGHIDVLAITVTGVPVIVECKRKNNPDMRYLIAQVFEYASYLDSMKFNEFETMVNNYFESDRCQEEIYKNKTFEDVYKNFITKVDYEYVEEDINIKEEIIENLNNGEFYLVITVDRIDEKTLRTINFLNDKLEKLRIEVIEIKKFESKSTEVFIPEHINQNRVNENNRTAPGLISFEEMLDNTNFYQENIIRAFKRFWKIDENHTIKMQTKGFSARYKDNSILWVFEDKIQINRFFKKDYGEEMYTQLEKIIRKYFDSHIIRFKEDFNLEKLKKLIEDIRNTVLVNFD